MNGAPTRGPSVIKKARERTQTGPTVARLGVVVGCDAPGIQPTHSASTGFRDVMALAHRAHARTDEPSARTARAARRARGCSRSPWRNRVGSQPERADSGCGDPTPRTA